MSKNFTLVTLLALLPFLSTVFSQVPSYPDVWDSAYPMNRCVDFCAFLRPGQICPTERYNPNCLCSVYNIRLPAVPTIFFHRRSLQTVHRMLEVEECYCRG